MTDPTSPADPPGAPKRAVVRNRWHRFSMYAGGIALILAMWICGILYTIRYHPDRFVDDLRANLPFSSSRGEVMWLNRRTLAIENVKLGDFFYADSIVVTASPFGLLRRHVAKVQITGGQIFTTSLAAMMQRGTGKGTSIDWTIGQLEINRGTILLQDLAPELPAVPVRLGVAHPLILHHIQLAQPDAAADSAIEQKMDIQSVNIVSPFDPLAPVLSFPLIRVRFTYPELWRHHIREITLVRPVIFLGEDLFWFSNEFNKQRSSAPAQGVEAPWEVGHFEVQYGQLALNAFGQPQVRFPFFFKTQVDDIRLDQLDKISARTNIPIIRLDQDYPDYKVRLVNLHGNLSFSVPPTDTRANNVVPTVFMDELSWNDIPATEVWTSVTFDPTGMYGKLGGKCEGGYIKGNFEIYYTKNFTWNANLFTEKINSQPITQKLGGRYIDLTGELNGQLSVQGKATEILACHGLLTLPHAGVLQIKSLDSLIKEVPGQVSLKDQALKIAVDAFRTYPYETGEVKIDYQPTGGVGTMKLTGPRGKRQFDIYWHPDEAPDSSKVANAAHNQ